MEFLEGFLVTDIYSAGDYKLKTKQLLHLCHKLRDMGHDDSAKDRLKIPSILKSHCPMRIATNSIYLYKAALYPKKFNKIL